jgi:hypothetical protein
MMHPNRVVSLLEMLELNAQNFIVASDELARIKAIIDNTLDDANKTNPVDAAVRPRFLMDLGALMESLLVVGARVAWVAAAELHAAVSDANNPISYAQTSEAIHDIKKRLRDELGFVKLYVVSGDRANLLGGAENLLGQPTADRFKSIWFDCEEAAKCLVLGRPTACVFHAMRMLEIGIRALARRLQIPDPLTPKDRNWGEILKAIKDALDAQYPRSKRLPGSEGAFLEGVYASLDAVKNPWRNATMHVEEIYTDSEAFHILTCSARLIQKMAEGFDEDGGDVSTPNLLSPTT